MTSVCLLSDIAGTEMFKILAERISHLEHTLKEKEAQTKIPSPEESRVLPNPESNDEELVEKERRAAEEKRIQEGSRLRKQREQLTAELNEVKAQLIKRQSLEEFKTLLTSCTNRIEVYQSEVSRLKLLLAAKAGDEDLVNFLQTERSGDVAELRKRLKASEERASDLEKQVTALSEQAVPTPLSTCALKQKLSDNWPRQINFSPNSVRPMVNLLDYPPMLDNLRSD
ncbi:hypothetical protein EDB89DRAFT_98204 [Lactarius sanguifluus]|nr:hypothetical protein EDB89DRAFT_98204 [Lactarius sanguifluus]